MKSVLEAARSGDELATLRALLVRLAVAMDSETTPVYTLPRLAGQLLHTLKRISDVQPAEKLTLSDELERRRAARGSAEAKR